MADKRSRKQRRVRVKTPAGRRTIHYRPKKKSASGCSSCRKPLHGVTQSRGVASSRRNPSRPYSGVLCSRCTRLTIKNAMVR